MKGIKIIKYKTSYTDKRGEIYNKLFAPPLKELAFFTRKKGAVSGKHYHEGIHPSKNPERFFIISGKMRFYARDLKTGKEMKKTITPFTEIQISPNIYHELTALTASIFMELKKEKGGYDDVFRI